jgi:ubiquinone/menaquinone biosynthesis C-methylase UbiE
MSHAKYVMLLEKKLFLAPLPPNPQRILDIGTGTGGKIAFAFSVYGADMPI